MQEHLQTLLGQEAQYLLDHRCETISKDKLYLPGPDFIDRVVSQTDRKPSVLRNLAQIYNYGV